MTTIDLKGAVHLPTLLNSLYANNRDLPLHVVVLVLDERPDAPSRLCELQVSATGGLRVLGRGKRMWGGRSAGLASKLRMPVESISPLRRS